MMQLLLTRDEFKRAVLERDNYTCVFCDNTAVDAHHILDRKLFSDGGYYLNNGASVCAYHHMKCETTEISVEDVRNKCNIITPVIPDHFYEDLSYDKWGNILLSNGTRLKGDLFFDDGVQKILAPYLSSFAKYIKYPRTYHVPWTGEKHDDDKMHQNMDIFNGVDVVVSIKFDGENSSMYNDYIHARSIDSKNHESRNWLKSYWNNIKHEIPDDWRICGENLYAKHSIKYNDLKSYFYGFSIWNERNECLSWDDTIQYFDMLNIHPVTVIYRGIYDEDKIKSLWSASDYDNMEGYVIRFADSFKYSEFKNKVAKFVRPKHVQTSEHWMSQKIEVNGLIYKE